MSGVPPPPKQGEPGPSYWSGSSVSSSCLMSRVGSTSGTSADSKSNQLPSRVAAPRPAPSAARAARAPGTSCAPPSPSLPAAPAPPGRRAPAPNASSAQSMSPESAAAPAAASSAAPLALPCAIAMAAADLLPAVHARVALARDAATLRLSSGVRRIDARSLLALSHAGRARGRVDAGRLLRFAAAPVTTSA